MILFSIFFVAITTLVLYFFAIIVHFMYIRAGSFVDLLSDI